jgi:quercetin dioxygenase-like cupin family protein
VTRQGISWRDAAVRIVTVTVDATPGGRDEHERRPQQWREWEVQQAPGLWRTDLRQHDLSVPGREVIQQRVDIGPEATPIKHTHLGEEIIYILEGSLEYQLEGQPTRTCNAGDALTVSAGAIHAVRNVGSGDAAELAAYVVKKGSRSSCWPSERQPGAAILARPRPAEGKGNQQKEAA